MTRSLDDKNLTQGTKIILTILWLDLIFVRVHRLGHSANTKVWLYGYSRNIICVNFVLTLVYC